MPTRALTHLLRDALRGVHHQHGHVRPPHRPHGAVHAQLLGAVRGVRHARALADAGRVDESQLLAICVMSTMGQHPSQQGMNQKQTHAREARGDTVRMPQGPQGPFLSVCALSEVMPHLGG